MTLAVYPPELRQCFAGELSTALPDRRVIAQPARGRPLMRGGPSTSGGRPVSASTFEPTGNVPRFWRFWKEEIGEGAEPFYLRNQQIDGRSLLDENGSTLLDENDAILRITAIWICQFVSVPQERRLSNRLWQLTFELLVIVE